MAKPVEPSNDSSSDRQYACVGCNKIFRKWKYCKVHSEKCCPGEQISLDEAAALANTYSNAGLSFELKTMRTCPACNEAFLNKKTCVKHMEKCSFGLVDKKPKPVWVCKGCGGSFATPAGYHAHEGILAQNDSRKEEVAAKPASTPTAILENECTNTTELNSNLSSHRKFACLGCRQIFAEWRLCQSHRNKSEICRDKKFKMKNSEAFAQALDANPLATPSPLAVTTKDAQATPETTLETSLPTTKSYMCPSCKEKFEKKKKCKEHIAKCNFGLVGHLSPMKFHVCSGCEALFETANSCRDHCKGCWKLREKKNEDKTSSQAH